MFELLFNFDVITASTPDGFLNIGSDFAWALSQELQWQQQYADLRINLRELLITTKER